MSAVIGAALSKRLAVATSVPEVLISFEYPFVWIAGLETLTVERHGGRLQNHERRANKYESATPAAPTTSMRITRGTVLLSPDSENCTQASTGRE